MTWLDRRVASGSRRREEQLGRVQRSMFNIPSSGDLPESFTMVRKGQSQNDVILPQAVSLSNLPEGASALNSRHR